MTVARVFGASLGAMAMIGLGAHAHADVRVTGIEDADLLQRIDELLPDDDDPANRVEARRMARDAAGRIESLLRSQGYYGATVDPRAEGDDTFEAVVAVQLGPRFVVDSLIYDVTGGEAAHAAALPGPGQAPAIRTGDPLLADGVLAEEAAAIARLRLGGYPDATPDPRRIVVDHATQSATVEYRIDAGRGAQFGALRLETDARLRERWLQRLVPFEAGQPYAPPPMESLSRRLSGTGAFDRVNVRLAPSEPGEGVEQRDVIVEIDEGDRHTIELGAGYGTSEGARLEGEWSRRNMFGGAETLTLAAVAATKERSFRTGVRAPHFLRPNRTATGSVLLIQEETDAYDRDAAVLSAAAEQPVGPRFTAGSGLSVERSRVVDVLTGRRDFSLLTVFGEVRFDGTEDLLDPKNGLRAAVRLEPGVAAGANDLTFLRTIVDVSAYKQLGDSPEIVLAGRARVGTISGASAADLPADRRFYAGGGGSVRGYAYQSLGPRTPHPDPAEDPLPLGGRSLLELSAEARVRVTETWGGVVFLDAGTTRRGQIPSVSSLSVGAGVGVRYYTAFGPIRADVAVPLTKRTGDRGYQIYLSIGQAF
jgi:translocation and assembly module TamA